MCLAVPGSIIEIHDDAGIAMGTVDFDGVRKRICLVYVPDADLGDYVLVHAGFAIARIDEQAAAETLALLHQLAETEDV